MFRVFGRGEVNRCTRLYLDGASYVIKNFECSEVFSINQDDSCDKRTITFSTFDESGAGIVASQYTDVPHNLSRRIIHRYQQALWLASKGRRIDSVNLRRDSFDWAEDGVDD